MGNNGIGKENGEKIKRTPQSGHRRHIMQNSILHCGAVELHLVNGKLCAAAERRRRRGSNNKWGTLVHCAAAFGCEFSLILDCEEYSLVCVCVCDSPKIVIPKRQLCAHGWIRSTVYSTNTTAANNMESEQRNLLPHIRPSPKGIYWLHTAHSTLHMYICTYRTSIHSRAERIDAFAVLYCNKGVQ